MAEAAVIDAKYKAKDKELYTAELRRDISIALYENLKDFKVDLPENMIVTSESKGAGITSNLDVLTSFTAMDVLKKQAAEKGKVGSHYHSSDN